MLMQKHNVRSQDSWSTLKDPPNFAVFPFLLFKKFSLLVLENSSYLHVVKDSKWVVNQITSYVTIIRLKEGQKMDSSRLKCGIFRASLV